MKNLPLTPVLTAAEMRLCDAATIRGGVPSRVLMERAARAVARYLLLREDLFPRGDAPRDGVLVLCGGGNNGGDGFAVARFLSDGSLGKERMVAVMYVGRWNKLDCVPDETGMSEECRVQYRLATDAGISVLAPDHIRSVLSKAAVVVDAMLGIGLSSPVRGVVPEVIEAVARSGRPVLALDIPTGIRADDGAVMGRALPARATVTVQALKAGLLLYPGADYCGELAVADIGIDSYATPAGMHLADEALLGHVLPPRARRSHKGSYGRVALLCGSRGMSGAAVLATRAALRAGAGLCEVMTPEENRTVLQITAPEAIVTAYDAAMPDRGAHLKLLRGVCERASVLVIGCGLGRSAEALATLHAVLELLPEDRPVVLDADALNLLSEDESLWQTRLLSSPKKRVVITPHPAEMARLCAHGAPDDRTMAVILEDTPAAAARFAERHGVTVVLKDAHTVVASPDGARYICTAGNAGMATGGSGDALAGILGALLGQVHAPDRTLGQIAAAGVYLHAAAGDLAAEERGEHGMLPSDLVEAIPLVTKGLSDSKTKITSM